MFLTLSQYRIISVLFLSLLFSCIRLFESNFFFLIKHPVVPPLGISPPLNFRDFALLRFRSSYYWGKKEQRKDRPFRYMLQFNRPFSRCLRQLKTYRWHFVSQKWREHVKVRKCRKFEDLIMKIVELGKFLKTEYLTEIV